MLLEVYDSFRKENSSDGSGRTVLIGEMVLPDGPEGEPGTAGETVTAPRESESAPASQAAGDSGPVPEPGQDQVA
jgi:hypothetical protein